MLYVKTRPCRFIWGTRNGEVYRDFVFVGVFLFLNERLDFLVAGL